MKAGARELCAKLKAAGWRFDGKNAKGWLVYRSGDRHVKVSPSGCEASQRAVALALAGTSGRKAGSVKSKAQRRRDLEAARTAAEDAQRAAERAEYLKRVENAPLIGALREQVRALEIAERDFQQARRLMETVPGVGRSGGRQHASHTAGRREARGQ